MFMWTLSLILEAAPHGPSLPSSVSATRNSGQRYVPVGTSARWIAPRNAPGSAVSWTTAKVVITSYCFVNPAVTSCCTNVIWSATPAPSAFALARLFLALLIRGCHAVRAWGDDGDRLFALLDLPPEALPRLISRRRGSPRVFVPG